MPTRTKKDRKTGVDFAFLGFHFGRVFGPCWRYVGPDGAPRAHGNRKLWTCTSKLTSETPTWTNLSPSWANLSATWNNLTLLDTTFHGFGGYLGIRNPTQIINHIESPKSLKCVRRHHGIITLRLPGLENQWKFIENQSKKHCEVEPLVEEPQNL